MTQQRQSIVTLLFQKVVQSELVMEIIMKSIFTVEAILGVDS